MSTMFTKTEAVSLLTDKMAVPNVLARLENDRQSLLQDIIMAWHGLSFQNLRLLSIPSAERHRPTLEEIKADIVSGIGGLCYNLNGGVFFLLQALDYKVKMARATCTSTVLFPGNHIIVYVYDLCLPGDCHLLECGFGFPTYRAVDINFEEESPIFEDSYLEYKYVKHDGKILRMHRKGCPVRSSGKKNPVTDFYIGDWRRFYEADLDGTTDLSYFDSYFEDVWTKPEASPFHTTFRVIKTENRKAIMIINQKTLLENENGELVGTDIDGGDEGIVSTVRKYFPALPESMVRQALANYKALSTS